MEIKKLPDGVISRIAAGEVITSPYNIIKELIENSIDAKASSISINLDSSLKNITIRDNGTGIHKEDLKYLCYNHYTSKTESLKDLKNKGLYNAPESSLNDYSENEKIESKEIISSFTYGFRGEALHSISLVSKLKVTTRTKLSEEGVGVVATYNNDQLLELRPVAFEGTGSNFEVKDIFYNNVIRSEHYRKNKSALLSCVDLVKSYGIVFFGIECRVNDTIILESQIYDFGDPKLSLEIANKDLTHDKSNKHTFESYEHEKPSVNQMDKKENTIIKSHLRNEILEKYLTNTKCSLTVSANNILEESLLLRKVDYVYKNFINSTKNTSKDCLRHYKSKKFNLICSDVSHNCPDTKFIFFINSRLVTNLSLKNKILQKYKKLNKAVKPFVFIEIFTDYVDVNVHPSKSEVLVDDESIFTDILQTFDTLFSDKCYIPGTSNHEYVKNASQFDNLNISNFSDYPTIGQLKVDCNYKANKTRKENEIDILSKDSLINSQSFSNGYPNNLGVKINDNSENTLLSKIETNPDNHFEVKKNGVKSKNGEQLDMYKDYFITESDVKDNSTKLDNKSFLQDNGDYQTHDSYKKAQYDLERNFSSVINNNLLVASEVDLSNVSSDLNSKEEKKNIGNISFCTNVLDCYRKNCINDFSSNQNSSFSNPFDNPSSPYKVYSSPFTRQISEITKTTKKCIKKYSLISLQKLKDEIVEIESSFLKNLVYVGVFDNFLFVQHQLNLLKIELYPFLNEVFYQKFIFDFGNFECTETLQESDIQVNETLVTFLRDYFSIHIENNKLIGVPKIYDIDEKLDFSNFSIFKTTEYQTIKNVAKSLADIYSRITLDIKIFNRIKTEAKCTKDILSSISVLTDVKEMYKTFDRC